MKRGEIWNVAGGAAYAGLPCHRLRQRAIGESYQRYLAAV